ncbi:hypothetical protein ASPCAL13913 [Aspergillus calidoustus]|uniref:Uncharacterized protein n=1 Tax=Aspergillus calidoustus TaxID=454130 RepID=A0A0U5GEL3_ASPCI|nr:hypothetical protein ASPCAL13913 [Aspergillus calidoustus]
MSIPFSASTQAFMESSTETPPSGPFTWPFIEPPRFNLGTPDDFNEQLMEDLCRPIPILAILAMELERVKAETRQLKEENEVLRAQVARLEGGGN